MLADRAREPGAADEELEEVVVELVHLRPERLEPVHAHLRRPKITRARAAPRRPPVERARRPWYPLGDKDGGHPGVTTTDPNDTLSVPLLRMAKLFVGGGLPAVADVRDVYAYARDLRARGVPIQPAEEVFLRQVTWTMLQLQHDQEESELHQALARLASLVLAIIEDDDFSIPDGCRIGSRVALEALAVQLARDMDQLDMQLAAAMGVHGIDVRGAQDLDGLERRLPRTPELDRVLRAARIHLRQGEGLLAAQRDPARAERHRARLAEACERTGRLLARLLAVPPERDHPVVRANLQRRELRRIEVDALGVERLSEHEQERRTRELLSWADDDLGEQLTDENKAALAERLRAIAAEAEDEASASWFFDED